MNFLKRQWPVIVAFGMGLAMWMRYYVPTEQSATLETEFARWARIIVGFAAIFGLVSVLRHHLGKIHSRKAGFGFSIVTLVSFGCMALAGFLPLAFPGFAARNMEEGSLFKWMFDNMMVPMQATMFSILAFFIASAAFRAFRARSPEATALLVAACILMIGRVPIGSLISDATPIFQAGPNAYHLLDFPEVASWLLNVPNAASQRGIMLGVILSQIAIAVRIIFGIERTYMGGSDK
jgi:hypothetical protein